MNSQTGDIFQVFDEKTLAANFGKPLELSEAFELRQHSDTQERLRRYKQMHANDTCGNCSQTLRAHSLREWQHCEAVTSHARLVAQLKVEVVA
jgi:hypothetical protein